MEEVVTVCLDIAKSVFQVHGVDAEGQVVVQRKIRHGAPPTFDARVAPVRNG